MCIRDSPWTDFQGFSILRTGQPLNGKDTAAFPQQDNVLQEILTIPFLLLILEGQVPNVENWHRVLVDPVDHLVHSKPAKCELILDSRLSKLLMLKISYLNIFRW